jgi:hypothetical protein
MPVNAGDAGFNATVKIVPVSPKMNFPKYNEPDCFEPLAAPSLIAAEMPAR